MISIKVEGVDKVQAMLENMPKAIQRALIATVKDTAAAVEAKAKEKAPVDTGTLRRAIHTEQSDDLTAIVASGVNYAVFQEYGTRFQSGTPHMRPAAFEIAQKVPQALVNNIAKEIKGA